VSTVSSRWPKTSIGAARIRKGQRKKRRKCAAHQKSVLKGRTSASSLFGKKGGRASHGWPNAITTAACEKKGENRARAADDAGARKGIPRGVEGRA